MKNAVEIELANMDEMEWLVRAWETDGDAPCCGMSQPWAGLFCAPHGCVHAKPNPEMDRLIEKALKWMRRRGIEPRWE
jgi:hypothetical protein